MNGTEQTIPAEVLERLANGGLTAHGGNRRMLESLELMDRVFRVGNNFVLVEETGIREDTFTVKTTGEGARLTTITVGAKGGGRVKVGKDLVIEDMPPGTVVELIQKIAPAVEKVLNFYSGPGIRAALPAPRIPEPAPQKYLLGAVTVEKKGLFGIGSKTLNLGSVSRRQVHILESKGWRAIEPWEPIGLQGHEMDLSDY